MLGRLLAEWGDRPAGALYLLPLWNPVLVAEQVGVPGGRHPRPGHGPRSGDHQRHINRLVLAG
ncbi:MAG TPA: hypothetical protein VHK25_12975 [Acidimicrobiales bacterium]|nr:hypothetical protein [Acidimicrobiales bacterium]